jgi:hypothetical protein
VEIRHLPHDRSFIEVFLDGDHIGTAYPHERLTAEQEQDLIERREADRAEARKRFTVANRMRRTAHPTTERLTTDKTGNRIVADDTQYFDLLAGGKAALEGFLGDGSDLDPAEADGQGMLL